MKIPKIPKDEFASRLKQRRKACNFSMEALAQATGRYVTKQALSKYELGLMFPKTDVIEVLARALSVSPSYFYEERQNPVQHIQIQLAPYRESSVKQETYMLEQIKERIEQYLEIENLLGKSIVPYQEQGRRVFASAEEAVATADALRTSWHLGQDPLGNLMHLFSRHGITLLRMEGPKSLSGAVALVNQERPFLMWCAHPLSIEQQRESLMHLFGRLLCFQSAETKKTLPYVADFAREMLLPAAEITRLYQPGESLSFLEVKQLQQYYGLTLDSTMKQIYDQGILNHNRYQHYKNQKLRHPILQEGKTATAYPEQMLDSYEVLLHAAVARHIISLEKAINQLPVCPEQFKQQLLIL